MKYVVILEEHLRPAWRGVRDFGEVIFADDEWVVAKYREWGLGKVWPEVAIPRKFVFLTESAAEAIDVGGKVAAAIGICNRNIAAEREKLSSLLKSLT